MDLCFEPTRGKPFTIEVGYFDTMLEIKEKVHKNHSIPVSKQTLLFNGQVLADDLNIHSSDILDRSRIQIVFVDQSQPQQQQQPRIVAKVEPTESQKIHLVLKLPNTKLNVKSEIDTADSIQRLKERIQEMDGVPASRLVLRSQGNELQDNRLIGDYNLSERSEIQISAKPSPATSSSTGSGNANATHNNNQNSNNNNSTTTNNSGGGGGGGGVKRTMTTAAATAVLVVRVVVQTTNGESRKVPVEVNALDSVGVLRTEIERRTRQRGGGVALPTTEGYFFIYKQNVMDEDRTFRWHGVASGDTIEIFNGSVSDGS